MELAKPPQGLNPGPAKMGVDQNAAPKANNADQTRAGAPGAGVSEDESGAASINYSCSPIQNLQIGKYQFEQGALVLDSKDAAKFDQLLESMPQSTRSSVRKLDQSEAERIARRHARQGIRGTFDSSLGREAIEQLHRDSPTVGREDIAHEKSPQTDNNVPVVPTKSTDPEGKTGVDQGAHIAPNA